MLLSILLTPHFTLCYSPYYWHSTLPYATLHTTDTPLYPILLSILLTFHFTLYYSPYYWHSTLPYTTLHTTDTPLYPILLSILLTLHFTLYYSPYYWHPCFTCIFTCVSVVCYRYNHDISPSSLPPPVLWLLPVCPSLPVTFTCSLQCLPLLLLQVRTLFVSGLPMDAKPRELYLLFRAYKVSVKYMSTPALYSP